MLPTVMLQFTATIRQYYYIKFVYCMCCNNKYYKNFRSVPHPHPSPGGTWSHNGVDKKTNATINDMYSLKCIAQVCYNTVGVIYH